MFAVSLLSIDFIRCYLCDDVHVHTYILTQIYMYIHTYTLLLKLYFKSLLKLRQCFTQHGTARLGRDIKCRCDC